MNIQMLDELLEKEEIPYSWYYIHGLQYMKEQKTCIEKRNGKWYVFYSERGKETSVLEFNNENDACNELYNRMKDHKTKMNRLRQEGKIK